MQARKPSSPRAVAVRSWLAIWLQHRRRHRAVPAPNAPVFTGVSWAWDQSEVGWVDIYLQFSFAHGSFPVGTLEIWFHREGTEPPGLVASVLSTETDFWHNLATPSEEILFYTLRYVGDGVTGPFCPDLPVFPTRLPAAPTDLSATDNGSTVFLTWTDQSNGETGFRVYRDNSLLAGLGANSNAFNDNDVIIGHHYFYYVVAFNGFGESAWSNEIEVTVGA